MLLLLQVRGTFLRTWGVLSMSNPSLGHLKFPVLGNYLLPWEMEAPSCLKWNWYSRYLEAGLTVLTVPCSNVPDCTFIHRIHDIAQPLNPLHPQGLSSLFLNSYCYWTLKVSWYHLHQQSQTLKTFINSYLTEWMEGLGTCELHEFAPPS